MKKKYPILILGKKNLKKNPQCIYLNLIISIFAAKISLGFEKCCKFFIILLYSLRI